MLNVRQMKRLHLAAKKDKNEQRFFDDFQESLDKGQVRLEDVSIRELAENFIEDGHEAVMSWNPRNQSGAVTMKLLEDTGAVTTGGFSKITGQLLVNRVLESYQNEDTPFSKIVPTVPTQLNGQKIPGISNIGDEAGVVEEGKPYPMAGVSENYVETPLTTKRGMIVALTREAVFFDLTSQLVKNCSEVGTFLAINKEKRVIDTIIDENVTTYRYKWQGTSYATYQTSTPWINSKTSNGLVDWTNVDAAEILLNQMTDPFTGEPILVEPKHLIVTRANRNVANRILTATGVQTVTPGYATSANPNLTSWQNPIKGYELLWSAQLAARMATDTNWFLGDLTKAFAYMENWPITVVQAPSNSEEEFTRDVVMRWKASERGTPATLDPRYMVKSAA